MAERINGRNHLNGLRAFNRAYSFAYGPTSRETPVVKITEEHAILVPRLDEVKIDGGEVIVFEAIRRFGGRFISRDQGLTLRTYRRTAEGTIVDDASIMRGALKLTKLSTNGHVGDVLKIFNRNINAANHHSA